MPPGIYFVKLKTPSVTIVEKVKLNQLVNTLKSNEQACMLKDTLETGFVNWTPYLGHYPLNK